MIKSLIHSFVICPKMDEEYIKISHGKGVFLYDEEGREFLDASSGSACVANIGHGRADMVNTLSTQSELVTILPTHAFSSKVVESYLNELVDFCSYDFDSAWTTMSGTEAVENALKLALQFHKIKGDESKYKIIGRDFSYHGNSIFTLDVGGFTARKDIYKDWHHHFSKVSTPYAYRRADKLSDHEYCEFLIDEFEKCILAENPDTIAAFIAEPIIGAALGAVKPPKGYFEGVINLCKKYNILFVSDEVLTGFGRTGKKFGFEHFDVVPDIIAAGKGISGGYFPLSAVIASKRVMEPFKKEKKLFYGGNTYACNPLGAAVGRKLINILNDENLIENARVLGAYLREKLLWLSNEYGLIGDVRGEGLLVGFELVKDKKTREPYKKENNIATQFYEECLLNGVVIYPGGNVIRDVYRDHILVTPPLTVTIEEIDLIIEAVETSIVQILKKNKR